MIPPSTAREALMIEALGDMATLMDRVEASTAALDQTRLGLVKANNELAARVTAFESRMAAITENAKTVAVEHIARRTSEIAQRSNRDQAQAMKEAARDLFNTEFGATLNGLVMSLRPLIKRFDQPWQSWLVHCATAAVSSALSGLLVWLWLHR
jgi:hypothetical protein